MRLDAELVPGRAFTESENHVPRLLGRGRGRIVDRADEGLARYQRDETLADEFERPRLTSLGRLADLAHGRRRIIAQQLFGHHGGLVARAFGLAAGIAAMAGCETPSVIAPCIFRLAHSPGSVPSPPA